MRALAGTPHAGLLIPAWVENTSAFGPGRRQMADDMRRISGLPTTGDRQGAQDWQQQQAAAAAKAELDQATAKAEIALKAANAKQADARSELARAQAAQTLLQGDQIADEVHFTDGGTIVESGPPAQLFDHPRKDRTRAFLSQIL